MFGKREQPTTKNGTENLVEPLFQEGGYHSVLDENNVIDGQKLQWRELREECEMQTVKGSRAYHWKRGKAECGMNRGTSVGG